MKATGPEGQITARCSIHRGVRKWEDSWARTARRGQLGEDMREQLGHVIAEATLRLDVDGVALVILDLAPEPVDVDLENARLTTSGSKNAK